MKTTKKTNKDKQSKGQESNSAGVHVAPVELLRTKPAKSLAEAYKGRPKGLTYIDLGELEE